MLMIIFSVKKNSRHCEKNSKDYRRKNPLKWWISKAEKEKYESYITVIEQRHKQRWEDRERKKQIMLISLCIIFRCQQKPKEDVKLFMLRDTGAKWIYVNFLTAVEVNMEWAWKIVGHPGYYIEF